MMKILVLFLKILKNVHMIGIDPGLYQTEIMLSDCLVELGQLTQVQSK